MRGLATLDFVLFEDFVVATFALANSKVIE
jgi:hypothetical protein